MSELQCTIDEKSTLMDAVGRWIPRIGVALLFLAVGGSKFPSHELWVRIFDPIGFGQWFRVFTEGFRSAARSCCSCRAWRGSARRSWRARWAPY